MDEKKSSCEIVTGEGIQTSRGVVLLSGTLTCLTCNNAELFEWPSQDVKPEDLEGFDTLDLVLAVAHTRNWIAQRVINTNDGKFSLFVLCPVCMAFFLSATAQKPDEGSASQT